MKGEFETMEAYLRELEALKKYDEVKRLNQEVSELKGVLSWVQAERDKLKEEMLVKHKAEEEAAKLKEALKQAQQEVSRLKETKAVLKGGELTLEEAAREFLKSREAEIRLRVGKESEEARKDFEAKAPQLVYKKLIAILKEPEWPVEITQLIERKAEEKAQSKMDDEFRKRVSEAALDRLKELKRTEWHPFVEHEVSRIGSDLVTLATDLQGTWHFPCDRCQRTVTVDIGPREIAVLLKGERVAECPQCQDFNLPPAPPIAAHKISGSSLEDLVAAYLASKGPLGKDSH